MTSSTVNRAACGSPDRIGGRPASGSARRDRRRRRRRRSRPCRPHRGRQEPQRPAPGRGRGERGPVRGRPTSAAVPCPTGSRYQAAGGSRASAPDGVTHVAERSCQAGAGPRASGTMHARHIASICRADIVRAVLELAILGLSKEHPMHGYDLRKRLRGDFGLLSSLSFGSLYPALARLEAAGAVHEVPSGAARPGSSVGRSVGLSACRLHRRRAGRLPCPPRFAARGAGAVRRGHAGPPCLRAHGARRRGLPPLARDRGAQAGGRPRRSPCAGRSPAT